MGLYKSHMIRFSIYRLFRPDNIPRDQTLHTCASGFVCLTPSSNSEAGLTAFAENRSLSASVSFVSSFVYYAETAAEHAVRNHIHTVKTADTILFFIPVPP